MGGTALGYVVHVGAHELVRMVAEFRVYRGVCIEGAETVDERSQHAPLNAASLSLYVRPAVEPVFPCPYLCGGAIKGVNKSGQLWADLDGRFECFFS